MHQLLVQCTVCMWHMRANIAEGPQTPAKNRIQTPSENRSTRFLRHAVSALIALLVPNFVQCSDCSYPGMKEMLWDISSRFRPFCFLSFAPSSSCISTTSSSFKVTGNLDSFLDCSCYRFRIYFGFFGYIDDLFFNTICTERGFRHKCNTLVHFSTFVPF